MRNRGELGVHKLAEPRALRREEWEGARQHLPRVHGGLPCGPRRAASGLAGASEICREAVADVDAASCAAQEQSVLQWEFDKILGEVEWDAARYAKGYDTKARREEVGVLSALKHGLGAGFKGGPMAKESKTSRPGAGDGGGRTPRRRRGRARRRRTAPQRTGHHRTAARDRVLNVLYHDFTVSVCN